MSSNVDGPKAPTAKCPLTSILIATNDEETLARLTLAVRETYFSVIETSNGRSALELCLNSPPNLAILDCDMQGPSGIDIAEKILRAKRLPVILMSFECDEQLVDRASDAGAMAFLIKSADSVCWIPMIRTALSRFAEIERLMADTAKLCTSLQQARVTSLLVGILMEKFHLSEKDAYDRLRHYSRNQSSKISDIALDLSARLSELNGIIGQI